jgi:hypothetical protein
VACWNAGRAHQALGLLRRAKLIHVRTHDRYPTMLGTSGDS